MTAPRKRPGRPAQQAERRAIDRLRDGDGAIRKDAQEMQDRAVNVLSRINSQHPLPFTFDRSRYPAAYLALGLSEAAVQRDILRALRAAGVAAWAVDSGGRAMRSRAGAGGAGAGTPGFPDIVGVIPKSRFCGIDFGAKPVFIEVKRPALIIDGRIRRPAGKPSPAQVEFIERALALGAAAGVAYSVSDALEIAGVRS